MKEDLILIWSIVALVSIMAITAVYAQVIPTTTTQIRLTRAEVTNLTAKGIDVSSLGTSEVKCASSMCAYLIYQIKVQDGVAYQVPISLVNMKNSSTIASSATLKLRDMAGSKPIKKPRQSFNSTKLEIISQ